MENNLLAIDGLQELNSIETSNIDGGFLFGQCGSFLKCLFKVGGGVAAGYAVHEILTA